MKKIGMFLLGIFCLIYLLNPGAGIFEIIPDNIPFFGNLDEAAAVATLLMCLNYFGIDPFRFFRQNKADDENRLD